eukprot:Filipodium_phascolosomae@DN993_c0_g1_i1.p1
MRIKTKPTARPDSGTLRKIVKLGPKRIKPFMRWQSKDYIRVKPNWRKPRGIDNCVRRRFSGVAKMPSVGYKNDKRIRHRDKKSGKYTFRVANLRDLEMMLMHNDNYQVVIASPVGAKTRKLIVERADELGVTVTNRWARLDTAEN